MGQSWRRSLRDNIPNSLAQLHPTAVPHHRMVRIQPRGTSAREVDTYQIQGMSPPRAAGAGRALASLRDTPFIYPYPQEARRARASAGRPSHQALPRVHLKNIPPIRGGGQKEARRTIFSLLVGCSWNTKKPRALLCGLSINKGPFSGYGPLPGRPVLIRQAYALGYAWALLQQQFSRRSNAFL